MTTSLRDVFQQRLFRFVTVGVGAALMFFALSWLLVSLGLPPFAGSVIAYAMTFMVAYLAQRGWTFEGRHGHGSALPRYLAAQLGCALFAGVLSHMAVENLGLSHMAMSALATFTASALSYFLSSKWVFPHTD